MINVHRPTTQVQINLHIVLCVLTKLKKKVEGVKRKEVSLKITTLDGYNPPTKCHLNFSDQGQRSQSTIFHFCQCCFLRVYILLTILVCIVTVNRLEAWRTTLDLIGRRVRRSRPTRDEFAVGSL